MAADQPPLNPPVKIRSNAAGISGEGGFFLALDKGYFREEGVDVEIVAGTATGAGMDTVARLVSSEIDLGTLAPGAGLFNAVARKIGVTGLIATSTVGAGDKSNGLVVRQDHIDSGRYKTPADFKGMKIAVLTIGGTAHYNVVKALALGGLRPADIEITNMPFPDALVALGNKNIDAAFEIEPFITAGKARGVGSLVIPGGQTSAGAPTIMLYSNTAFVTKNRQAIERFLFALMRGQRDFSLATSKGEGIDALYAVLQKYT